MFIPNCKKVSNESLCEILKSNPCLLALDITNKLTPCIDREVMKTIVYSCRFLTVLKLSDYRLDDPENLLVLCGKSVVRSKSTQSLNSSVLSQNSASDVVAVKDSSLLNSTSGTLERESDDLIERVQNLLKIDKDASGEGLQACRGAVSGAQSTWETTVNSDVRNVITDFVAAPNNSGDGASSASVSENNIEWEVGVLLVQKGEERGEERAEEEEDGYAEDETQDTGEQSGEDVDPYEDDTSVSALEVEDHSHEYGCLELETLWLENVNLTDQVAAVLFQSLRHLRDINLSDTDICNPWRLLRTTDCAHLRHLEDLDVKSTALSRTALIMIPDFHPDLQKLSISSTTLPPPTYKHVARLGGIAELELIGGQFYPCEPEEIFTNGIVPAVSGVGEHLQSLNLTYFAHIEFSKIILSCPIIRHLDLSYTDIFVVFPCPSVGEMCPHLTTLHLDFAHIEARDSSNQIIPEDRVVQKMIGETPVLEEIFLCGVTLTDEALRTMFPGARYPLRIMNVSRCSKLTIAGVQHVWSKCPLLTSIDITHCKEIAVADYKTFSKDCQERPIFKLEGILEWK